MNKLQIIVNDADFRKQSDVAKIASRTGKSVRIIKGNSNLDAKSVLGIHSLGLKVGDIVTIESEDIDVLCEIKKCLEG